ncbi:MAG: hypothetical protein AAFV53_43890, partial [Myxococcota bacterium]
MRHMWMMGIALAAGCSGGEPADCPVCPEPTVAGPTLTDFETQLVDPMLEDIRAGVRPWDDQSVGICSRDGKKRECVEFLGASPGELPPGQYMVSAILRVPDVGPEGTWNVTLNVDCTTTRQTDNGSSTNTNNYNKSYSVKYVGAARG